MKEIINKSSVYYLICFFIIKWYSLRIMHIELEALFEKRHALIMGNNIIRIFIIIILISLGMILLLKRQEKKNNWDLLVLGILPTVQLIYSLAGMYYLDSLNNEAIFKAVNFLFYFYDPYLLCIPLGLFIGKWFLNLLYRSEFANAIDGDYKKGR